MNLLYVSGHRFIKCKNGDIFTTGQMGTNYFSRFEDSFDRITVIGYYENEDKKNIKKKVEKINSCSNSLSYHLVESSSKNNFFLIFTIHKLRTAFKSLIESHDRIATKAPSIIASYVVKTAKNMNIPCYLELVGCPWDALWNHSFTGKLIAPIVWYTTRKAVMQSPYVMYVTSKYLQKKYPNSQNTVSCSNVYLENFDEKVLKKRLNRIQNPLKEKIIVIGTIGAINVRYKGQQYMIEVLGKLKKEGYSNYQYHLVGGGDQSYLISVAKRYNVVDQVKFIGALPHEDIFKFLDNIDVYLQPSKTEGLPRALIEAMSRGLPAIGSDAGGIPELLDNCMIFSNSKNRIHEIFSIILKLSNDKMIKQAKRNYEESKKYDSIIINRRRNEFIKKFALHCTKKSGDNA